ncbi:MAG TPA: hypothetical protein VH325_12260 [Bryobacteraceae bacterium]|nr:hypothetical protein [Bryobacteraceae bacterium]
MRGIFSRRLPSLDQVLVVESGPRELADKFLRHLYEVQASRQVDVVTCYGSAPPAFQPERGICYSIHDLEFAGKRFKLIGRLCQTRYAAVSILCSGTPIMTRWKWLIALRIPAKTLIVNENGDFFFFDWYHWRIARTMVANRMGVYGGLRIDLLGQLLLFPFTLAFLSLYAAAIHLRRALR